MIKAILLAAGQSKRIPKENKLIKRYKGKPLINHILKSLIKSKVNKIILVLGYEKNKIKKIILRSNKIVFGINNDYKTGMASSIKIGLKKIKKKDKGFLIVHGDMPNISVSTINRIYLALINSKKKIILPKYKDVIGNPIGFKQSMIKKISKIKGDNGAKNIIKKNKKNIKMIKINSKSVIVDFDEEKNFK